MGVRNCHRQSLNTMITVFQYIGKSAVNAEVTEEANLKFAWLTADMAKAPGGKSGSW